MNPNTVFGKFLFTGVKETIVSFILCSAMYYVAIKVTCQCFNLIYSNQWYTSTSVKHSSGTDYNYSDHFLLWCLTNGLVALFFVALVPIQEGLTCLL